MNSGLRPRDTRTGVLAGPAAGFPEQETAIWSHPPL